MSFQLLFSPVQLVLVGGIRVSVGGGLRPGGSITDVWLGGASWWHWGDCGSIVEISQRYYSHVHTCSCAWGDNPPSMTNITKITIQLDG